LTGRVRATNATNEQERTPVSASTHSATHSDHGHAHDDHGLAHVASAKMLVTVWLSLIALTGITVWTANMHLHPFDLVIAMVIATVKGLLVSLFFMHLMYDRPFNGLIFMLSFVFAGLFVVFAMFDTGNNQPAIERRASDAPVIEAWRATIEEGAKHEAAHASGEHAPSESH
jgi:cytochrome c oxidase subunit 4